MKLPKFKYYEQTDLDFYTREYVHKMMIQFYIKKEDFRHACYVLSKEAKPTKVQTKKLKNILTKWAKEFCKAKA